jgi:hypothetical protein
MIIIRFSRTLVVCWRRPPCFLYVLAEDGILAIDFCGLILEWEYD